MKKAITQKLMAKLTISLLVPFALILMWSALLTKCNSSCICKQSEIQALLEFKSSLTDKSNYLTSWVGRHCCDWNGLGCEANNNNNLTCNVVKLDLRAAELEASHLSHALVHLHHLRYLDLSENSFHWSPIPKFIGSITSLEHLNLSNADFIGQTPHHLGNLTSLQFLDLQLNYDFFLLGPSLELDSWNWVLGLKNLQYLDMSYMNTSQASGSLTSVIQKLTYLRTLRLKYCKLTNHHFPEMLDSSTSSLLQTLDLSGNYLQNPLPHTIMNLTHLSFLDLSSNALSSSIPSWLGSRTSLEHLDLNNNRLQNPIPHIIMNLTRLSFLDLSSNALSSSIPSWLGSMTSLAYLDLSENSLKGPIPHILSNLTSLTFLDLAFNSLNLSIPSWNSSKTSRLGHLDLSFNSFSHIEGGIFKLIQGLYGLKYLDLSSNVIEENLTDSAHVHFTESCNSSLEKLDISINRISGQLPDCMMKFTALTELCLQSNLISGVIPASIGNLSSLDLLDISINRISGQLPDCFMKFTALRILNLYTNSIYGVLPSSFGNLSSLEWLDLSNNTFNGSIPASLGGLSSLESLDLSYNNFHGMINQDHFTNLSRLHDLDLGSNSLVLKLVDNWVPPFQLNILKLGFCEINSPIPKWLLQQGDIDKLDLSHTGVSGSLPDDLGDTWRYSSSLVLTSNHIDGQIPRSLCNLHQLNILDLSSNRFSGTIPGCLGYLMLTVLELSSNKLSGLIPASLVNLTGLRYLSLNNNILEGELPPLSDGLPNLLVMNLGENHLCGKIPPWSKESLPLLIVLRLQTNRLSGEIPESLCSLDKLHIIDLANNGLTGSVPRCIGNLSAMVALPMVGISYNNPNFFLSLCAKLVDVSVVEVVKGKPLEYTTILSLVVIIELSNNNLTGEIPTELTKLVSLQFLNLAHNHLTGSIPKKIGKMKALESIDLSNNHLSGLIPPGLSELNFLEYLNLAYNRLQGPIPTGNQIQTLNNLSMYMGNPDLCGDILPKKCTTNNHPKDSIGAVVPETDDDDGDERLWLYIPSVLGCITGFWGIIAVLIVKHEWRYAYFQLAEDVGNWIYVHAALSITRLGRKAT